MTAAPASTTGADRSRRGDGPSLEELKRIWGATWDDALRLWSPYLRLRPPHFCSTRDEEISAGLRRSFAAIRLTDQTVVISLRRVQPKLAAFALEILGHEIGHHVLCPADLSDNARMLARMRRCLPGTEHHAPMIANLYGDLLINDRLYRRHGLDMADVYRAIAQPGSDLWSFYLRVYEILWSLQRESLATDVTDEIEGDARIGARVIRSYAGQWLEGAAPFAALCLPYLLADIQKAALAIVWQDTIYAGAGGIPDGLTEIDATERSAVLDPRFDPRFGGFARAPDSAENADDTQDTQESAEATTGQYREPFEYGQILRETGLDISDHEAAIRYYRERAARHLVPFPHRVIAARHDPLPEGLDIWEIGGELNAIDWFETMMRSPVVVPGITTVQRTWGESSGGEPAKAPLDLDIYVDSSGSIPNPQVRLSHLTLAGPVIALSALRDGAAVQVTLWSGTSQFAKTDGFVREEHQILGILTGYFGGSTAFPIHALRDTYAHRPADAPPAHVLVISDDGVTTMFDRDEAGNDGREVANQALTSARGGGSMILNLWGPVEDDEELARAVADGWSISVVRDWSELIDFARRFSADHHGGPATDPSDTTHRTEGVNGRTG